MNSRIRKIFVWVIIFFVPVVCGQQLSVSSGQLNSIKFFAKSTFSNFEGTTSSVEGFIKWDSAFTNNSKIEFKVYLDSLDTGIGLRNTHMRDNYLETNKYPIVLFTGKVINQSYKTNFESEVGAEGILKIHGVERKQIIKGRLYDYGKLFKLESRFEISLSDFNIEQPSFLFISVDNDIVIECTVYLTKEN
ncbi:MAG: YceI family protein [Ignavibacteriota bacterium]